MLSVVVYDENNINDGVFLEKAGAFVYCGRIYYMHVDVGSMRICDYELVVSVDQLGYRRIMNDKLVRDCHINFFFYHNNIIYKDYPPLYVTNTRYKLDFQHRPDTPLYFDAFGGSFRRIQRWMRRVLDKRRSSLLLTAALGMYCRDSIIATLPSDVMRRIAAYV